MVTSATGVLKAMGDVLQTLVPKSVDPILFYATFLITVALLFVILQQIKFFEKSRVTAFLVSVVLAYFTASSAFVTVIVSKMFPNIGLALMTILGVMLVIVFLSPKSLKDGMRGTPLITIVVFVVTLALTWTFAAPELEKAGALEPFKNLSGFAVSNEDVAVIIFGIVLVGILFMLFRNPQKKSSGKGKFLDWLTEKKW